MILNCVYVYVHRNMCLWVQVSEESREGCQIPRPEVTGNCELTDVGVRDEFIDLYKNSIYLTSETSLHTQKNDFDNWFLC